MNIFEITIQKRKEGSWPIETKLTRFYDSLPVHHKGELKLSKQDFNELTSLKIQSQQYGQFLGRSLFQGEIYQAYLQALDSSWDGIRVLLIVEDKELEVLYWHWLCAPLEWNFISLNQRCCFSISLKTPTQRVFPPINQNDLRALILAASPQGLEEYSLASFNVQETVDSLKIALGQIPTDVLAVDGGLGMPTLDELCDRLTQTSYSLLHIVGHGQVQRGETFLYWATRENLVWPVEGSKLIERLQNIQNLPHFIFLSACETAKSEAGMALGGLAQRMVRELGIPAVLAMTENVTIETAALLSKAFYPRLRKHGEVDKALVEATSTLSRDDILVPALFSRLGRNSLFDINRNELSAVQIRQRTLHKKSPYKGLKRFNFQDREYFFGRDALIYKLFTAVNKSSFSLVLGASGSGKSSVVRAGLIPEIKEYIEIYKKFYYFIFTPDRDPFESLYRCLKNEEKDYNFSISETEIALKAKSGTLMEVINTLKKEDEYWFLFIDQFEQLFTICTDLEKRKNFIAGIVELAKKRESSVKIVLAMRSDFLEQFSFYPTLGAIANQNNIHLVTEMYPDELRRAIAQPAAKNGVVFEEGLIEQIIEEVERQKGYLPLLQYTLDLLWEKECKSIGADGFPHIEDRTLNKINYAALEGVRGALQKRVDEIYKDICEKNPEGELVTKQIFLKLVNIVEIDSESKFVSRRAYRNEFVGEPIESILKRFIDENLLVSSYEYSKAEKLLVGSRDDKYIEHATVEIAHEILLSSWEELKRWLEAEKEAIILKNWLAGETRKWLEVRAKDELKASDELLKGSRLEQVVELRKKNGFEKLGGLVAEENEFIDVSVSEKERIEREKEARRQRDIRTAWGIAAGSVMALVVSSSLGLMALKQTKQAQLNLANSHARTSMSMLSQGQDLDAFLEAIRAGKILQKYQAKDPQVWGSLIGNIYEGREHNRLLGHDSLIYSVSISNDDKTIVSGSQNGTIKLWNMETGEEIRSLTGHKSSVLSVNISKDGKTIVSGSQDGTIKLWNLETGEEIRTLTGHKSFVYSVNISNDGKTIVSGSSDNTVKVWNLETGEEIRTLIGHESWVFSVSISNDSKTIISGSNDKTIKVWNLETGEEIRSLTGHDDLVFSVSISKDNKTIVSGSLDETIKVWNLETGEEIRSLTGHNAPVLSVSISQDGKTIISGSYDNTVRVWNLKTGEEMLSLTGHDNWVRSVSISQDGRTIVSGSRTIKIWNVETGEEIHSLTGHNGLVNSVSISKDGKTIVSGSNDTTIKIWNLETGEEIRSLTGHNGLVNSVSISKDGKIIVSGSNDTTIKIWNIETGEEIRSLTGHNAPVLSVSISKDGKTIVSGSRTIKIWNVETGEEIRTLTGHNGLVNSVRISKDSKTIVSGSNDTTIKIWNIETGEEIHTLIGNDSLVYSVDISQDGKTIVSGSDSHTIKVWNLETGKEIDTLTGHKGQVDSVSISNDGKTIVSGSFDNTIKIWNIETGSEIRTLRGHDGGFDSVSISNDGKTIISGSFDNTIKVWNIDFDWLMERSCDWVRNYLQHNAPEKDKDLCDNIPPGSN